jgi:hypothetical protein
MKKDFISTSLIAFLLFKSGSVIIVLILSGKNNI